MSGDSSRCQARTTEAKASLTSIRSKSSIPRPVRSSSLRVAGIGPVSMMTGSTPTVTWSTTRARGRRPRRSAAGRLASRTAAAPSESCEDVPAVMRPSGLNGVLSCASDSRFVSGRIPWSVSTVPCGVSIGTVSRSKRPSSVAAAARACDVTASWSISRREISHCSAMRSALRPCGMNWKRSSSSCGHGSP